jgi:YD repeat-containing protein
MPLYLRAPVVALWLISELRFVGIVKSSLVDGQNLNFAIPVEYLKSLPLKYKLPVVAAGACAYRDRDREKLKGLVKSVFDEERSNQGETRKHMMVFDMDGNQVEYDIYTPEGTTLKKLTSYDENGFKTQVIRIASGRGKEGVPDKTMITFEDGVEDKIWTRQFSGIKKYSSTDLGTETYDNQGNMVEWLLKGQRIRYTYEPDGTVKEKLVYDGNTNTIRYRFSYKYDETGQLD